VRGLERLAHDGVELDRQGAEVDLVAQARGEASSLRRASYRQR
jgi:hypothetical protein